MVLKVILRTGSPVGHIEELPVQTVLADLANGYKLYVWPSTTLRAVCAQLHAAAPISQPLARHSIHVVSMDQQRRRLRVRTVLHGITRVSDASVAQILGGADDPLVQAALGHRLQRDEEGQTNSGMTIGALKLTDADFLEIYVQQRSAAPSSFSQAPPAQAAQAPLYGPRRELGHRGDPGPRRELLPRSERGPPAEPRRGPAGWAR